MSAARSAEHPAELVIVKRGHGGEEGGHHGGVWKIAYADFMTAMMAFFLVMWLINAANEETRSQVASYFNPVKLTDSVTNNRGLSEPNNKSKRRESRALEDSNPESTDKEDYSPTSGESDEKRFLEEELFKDPYVVLAQLAGTASQGSPAGPSKTGLATVKGGQSGLKSGEAFRDPFDPLSWQKVPATPGQEAMGPPNLNAGQVTEILSPVGVPAASGAKTTPMDEPKPQQVREVSRPEETQPAAEVSDKTPSPTGPSTKKSDPAVPQDTVRSADEKNMPGPPHAMTSGEPSAAEDTGQAARTMSSMAQINSDARAVKSAIDRVLAPESDGALPGIEVRATKEGVLVSLTDKANFGMFAIGSAEPRPKVVLIMEQIAAILNATSGSVVIRGHTDARPYRSATYDNWRLSTARAHMAQYMLVRAGFLEARIERVEGHADHMLKLPSDPEAAENRRIEILLRADPK